MLATPVCRVANYEVQPSAEAIEKAIRDLRGFPDTVGPFLGRAAAGVFAATDAVD
ncbi:MAG TPA: hypothetical protein VGA66_14275 [Mycobacterium sp.]